MEMVPPARTVDRFGSVEVETTTEAYLVLGKPLRAMAKLSNTTTRYLAVYLGIQLLTVRTPEHLAQPAPRCTRPNLAFVLQQ
jgi:hypothetical protein